MGMALILTLSLVTMRQVCLSGWLPSSVSSYLFTALCLPRLCTTLQSCILQINDPTTITPPQPKQ